MEKPKKVGTKQAIILTRFPKTPFSQAKQAACFPFPRDAWPASLHSASASSLQTTRNISPLPSPLLSSCYC